MLSTLPTALPTFGLWKLLLGDGDYYTVFLQMSKRKEGGL